MLESIHDAVSAAFKTEQVKALILCIKEETLSGRGLMSSLGLVHRPTFLYDYLQPALKDGYVEMTQPGSPKSPTQKYHLSEKGKTLLTLISR